MYEQAKAACFDPDNMAEPPLTDTATGIGLVEESGLSQETSPPFTPILDHLHHQEMDPSMEEQLHNIQNPNFGIFNNPLTNPNDETNINWTPANVVDMAAFTHYNDHETPTSTTSDLLTLLHLPRCSFPSSSTLLPPTPSLSFTKSLSPSTLGFLGELNPVMIPDNPSGSGSNTISYDPTAVPFDPLFHLNLPPQPSPLLRDLMFQTLPIGYSGDGNINVASNNAMFGMLEEVERERDIINGVAGIYLDGENNHHINPDGIFEFTNGNSCLGEGKEGKCPKNFVTERQRRQNFNEMYNHLRRLVPNPTKPDRASIVKDAIDYIQELKRTVGELKLLVEKKRISKERFKRLKTEDTVTTTTTTNNTSNANPDGSNVEKDKVVQAPTDGSSGQVKPDPDEGFNGSSTQLRSSWLLRKWKDSEVDVRIVDDDVTIKLVQRKKINCLLPISRTLDELHLDLLHVAGGHVGDYYSYLFNTKICEGSSVYASAIANKLIEVVEREYAAASVAINIPPTCSF